MVGGWIETQLWRGLSPEDRDFVLDIALLDRLDPDLISEVTGARNAGRRIASMDALAGLVLGAQGSNLTMRLHPLIKSHCERRRFAEKPERFRTLQGRIAEALARQGQTVEALRHAVEAGDTALLGRIAERTGGVRLWLERGGEALRAVDAVLTTEVLSKYPRLALLRCVALAISGDIKGAKQVYDIAGEETANYTRDRVGGDDQALRIDHIIVQGLLQTCECRSNGTETTALLSAAQTVVNEKDTSPLLRGMFSLGICMIHHQRASFDAAVEWASRARAALGRRSPNLAHVDFQVGSIAMARGLTREARSCYERALKVVGASHLRQGGGMMIGEVLMAELEVESSARNLSLDESRVSPRELGERTACFDVYAASIAVRAELALMRDDPEAALDRVEDTREYARTRGRTALERFASGLRVWILLASGKVDEAAHTWRYDGLPQETAECLDLETRSWREVEMLACARLRLFVALGEFAAGREFGAVLRAVSAERGLVRMEMRGLALSMVLEHEAGATDRASAHLADFLRLFARADYPRPLARHREIGVFVARTLGVAKRRRGSRRRRDEAARNPKRSW